MDSLFLHWRFCILQQQRLLCLNPCFNGFSFLTTVEVVVKTDVLYMVSILVLMDSLFLRMKMAKSNAGNPSSVSILVLMDSLFLLCHRNCRQKGLGIGLNPCFNGFSFLTQIRKHKKGRDCWRVSILVLMDSLFLHPTDHLV